MFFCRSVCTKKIIGKWCPLFSLYPSFLPSVRIFLLETNHTYLVQNWRGPYMQRVPVLYGPSGKAILRQSAEVECILVQALRLCTGRTADRRSRGIALPFHDNATKRGWGVSVTTGSSLSPRKTQYPLYRRLGGSQGRSGRERKISPPPGFDPRTVQPVASRYTDCVTRPTSPVGLVYFIWWWYCGRPRKIKI